MNMSATTNRHDELLEVALRRAVDACKDDDQHFAAFSAIQGKLWKSDLMLIGQAVNEWCDKDVRSLRKDSEIRRLVKSARTNASGKNGSCALQCFIDSYPFVRSPFWRTG